MTAGRSLARAGLIVTLAFLASRALGWVRLVVIGTSFGATAELDTFFAAFRIPDLIFQLVAAGALSSALIPVIAGLLETDTESRAWRVASTVANLMLAVLLVLAVDHVRRGAGHRPGDHARVQRGPVGPDRRADPDHAPQPDPAGAWARSRRACSTPRTGSAPPPRPRSSTTWRSSARAILLTPTFGIYSLAIGVVAGSACHIGIQVLPLRQTGFRWVPRIDLDDPRPVRRCS